MTTRREGSDGRVVPEGRRKAVPTAKLRGGKAITASEVVEQQELFAETADSPKGAVPGEGQGRTLATARQTVPKSADTTGMTRPAMMTLDEVAHTANLRRAFEQVERNDGAPGPDRQAIEDVAQHLDVLLPVLRRSLLDGSYRPGMIRRVWIPKVGGGERGLGIPNVVDRMVQQAVHQVLRPHYEPLFHHSSHGFRPGKSCHTAIAEAQQHLAAGHEWVVDLDLEKFFDRVHHERLLARLGQQIRDPGLLLLIRRMLKAKVVMPDGVVVVSEEGTPQGGPLSPLLSNIVLDELDRELARRGHRFVRYADDCNIYVRSERAGHRVMASVVRFIEGHLRLKVNHAKSAVARPGERHFVGFSLRRNPETSKVEVQLSKRSKTAIDKKIRELTPRAWGQSMSGCIQGLNRYLLGWIGFFGICTEEVVRTLHGLDAHIRRRLRAVQLRQWKRKRYIVNHLVWLGAKPGTAWTVIYRGHQSLWALSHCNPVDRSLNVKFFEDKGLLSLEKRYQAMRQKVAPAQMDLELG
jgi:group II intron reverse transcriptase/maturase